MQHLKLNVPLCYSPKEARGLSAQRLATSRCTSRHTSPCLPPPLPKQPFCRSLPSPARSRHLGALEVRRVCVHPQRWQGDQAPLPCTCREQRAAFPNPVHCARWPRPATRPRALLGHAMANDCSARCWRSQRHAPMGWRGLVNRLALLWRNGPEFTGRAGAPPVDPPSATPCRRLCASRPTRQLDTPQRRPGRGWGWGDGPPHTSLPVRPNRVRFECGANTTETAHMSPRPHCMSLAGSPPCVRCQAHRATCAVGPPRIQKASTSPQSCQHAR